MLNKRRKFLKISGIVCLGALLAPNELFASRKNELSSKEQDIRSISFYNVNSKEHLNVTYFKNGSYCDDAHLKINNLMADKRSGETTLMELSLIETLHKIHTISGSKEPIDVICGYRSPTTNAHLRETKSGVAKHSYHSLGQAADICIKDIPLERVHEIATSLNLGGVGFYPNSGFVHIDVGPARTWHG